MNNEAIDTLITTDIQNYYSTQKRDFVAEGKNTDSARI